MLTDSISDDLQARIDDAFSLKHYPVLSKITLLDKTRLVLLNQNPSDCYALLSEIEKLNSPLVLSYIQDNTAFKPIRAGNRVYLGCDMALLDFALYEDRCGSIPSLEFATTWLEPVSYKEVTRAIDAHEVFYKYSQLVASKYIDLPEENLQSKKAKQYVYFVLLGDDKVKIGRSNNPESRFKSLQTANPLPLSLIKVIETPNSVVSEKELHERFDHLRVLGEWFRYEGKLKEFLVPRMF